MVQEEKPKKKNKLLIILIIVLVLGAVGFGAYKFFFKGGNSTKGDLVVITLKDSNGSSKTISVDSEGTFDSLPTPVREGYTFDGWYTKEVGGAVVTASTTYKTVDVTTLYAHWTPRQYKITFVLGNGESNVVLEQAYGTKIVAPTGFTKANSTFDGWSEEVPETVPANDMTFTAKWKVSSYTVNFNSNGGTACNSRSVTYGSTYGDLPVPSRTGYQFQGWYFDNGSYNSQVTSASQVSITGDITVYAKWVPNTYTVYYSSDGKIVGNKKVTYGEVFGDLLPMTSSNFYEFQGWYFDNETFKNRVTIETKVTITSDVTLYAKWKCMGTIIVDNEVISKKPMIYLYPTHKSRVTVKLGYPGKLTTTYPKYGNGWTVDAYSDGTIKYNNRTYYGLYWEGINTTAKMHNEGFVVAGKDTAKFLEEKLKILGLTDREANEFIIYWLPQMEHNKYNYVYFETKKEIDNEMPLMVSPIPNSVIRVMMDTKPLDKKISLKEQKLTSPVRTGFTVVEWGGTIVE